MKVFDTEIPDVKIIEPTVFEDERGFFFESFNSREFVDQIGRDIHFVQDNHSKSARGVIRGLHYQFSPYAQGKLVRCIAGEIFDVAVDLRKSSVYFGQWVGVHLDSVNKRQIWIPEGFAHGFLVVSDSAEVAYKATAHHSPQHELGIVWNDLSLDIDWRGVKDPLLSIKDRQYPPLSQAKVFM